MITMHVCDGLAIKSDDCMHLGSYDPPVGIIIKYIAEDGSDYSVVACSLSGHLCYGCVFHETVGHPLSKLFKGSCGPDVTGCRCYGRVYKPLDTILEEL